jgi:hypothetical protein
MGSTVGVKERREKQEWGRKEENEGDKQLFV